MINLKNKKGEFIMKDYVMIGLLFMLIIASVGFILTDMATNPEISDNVDVSEIERFYDESYVERMNRTTTSRLTELQDAGFFQTVFLTTLEIVQMIPRLVGMTLRSLGLVVSLLISGGSEIIPSEIAMILATMIFAGLLWAAVYFIRRISK